VNDLELARHLTEIAGPIAMRWWRNDDLRIETKANGTVVSNADREVETELRRVLAQQCPDDAVLGEEHGASGSGPRRWIIDPIDGTANYVVGRRSWEVLVALEVDGEIEVGAISTPATGHRWWAARNEGAWLTGPDDTQPRRLRVSERRSLADAKVAGGDGHTAYSKVVDACGEHIELLGAGLLVAQGDVEVGLDAFGQPWDLAPFAVLVEEAGGRFSDPRGGRSLEVGGAIYSNGFVHDEVLALLV
jgi:histidinol-phosphatase